MYFKFDLDWLMDLDLLEAIMYGIILHSRTFHIRYDENGEVYNRISNNFITTWFKDLSPYRIRMSLNKLVEDKYIKILTVKKPSTKARYISTNITDLADTIYILKEWLDNYHIEVCVALGCLFRDYVHYGMVDESTLDDLTEMIPNVYQELYNAGLIDKDNELNIDMIEKFDEYKKSIIKNKPKS